MGRRGQGRQGAEGSRARRALAHPNRHPGWRLQAHSEPPRELAPEAAGPDQGLGTGRTTKLEKCNKKGSPPASQCAPPRTSRPPESRNLGPRYSRLLGSPPRYRCTPPRRNGPPVCAGAAARWHAWWAAARPRAAAPAGGMRSSKRGGRGRGESGGPHGATQRGAVQLVCDTQHRAPGAAGAFPQGSERALLPWLPTAGPAPQQAPLTTWGGGASRMGAASSSSKKSRSASAGVGVREGRRTRFKNAGFFTSRQC